MDDSPRVTHGSRIFRVGAVGYPWAVNPWAAEMARRMVRRLAIAAAGLVLAGCLAPSVTYEFKYMNSETAIETRRQVESGLVAIGAYLDVTPSGSITVTDIDPDGKRNPMTRFKVMRYRDCDICPISSEHAFSHVVALPIVQQPSSRFSNAIVHELTHVLAGVSYYGNRFLAEGLAVHVHGVLSRSDDAQSFARFPIHRLAREIVEKVKDRVSINHLFLDSGNFRLVDSTGNLSAKTGMAYVLAGSFVTFLIQREGPEGDRRAMATFLKLYRSGCAPCIYGKTFRQLEEEWIVFLAGDPVPRSKPFDQAAEKSP